VVVNVKSFSKLFHQQIPMVIEVIHDFFMDFTFLTFMTKFFTVGLGDGIINEFTFFIEIYGHIVCCFINVDAKGVVGGEVFR